MLCVTLVPSGKVQTISDSLEQVGLIQRTALIEVFEERNAGSHTMVEENSCFKTKGPVRFLFWCCWGFFCPSQTGTLLLPPPSREQHLELALHYAIQ